MYRVTLSDSRFIVLDTTMTCFIDKPFRIKKTIHPKENPNLTGLYVLSNKDKVYLVSIEEEHSNLKPGVYKHSQDIKLGDVVLGVGGTKRIVEELHTGEDDMYDIHMGEETYTVNAHHILHLFNTETKELLDIPVCLFLLLTDEEKEKWVMLDENI